METLQVENKKAFESRMKYLKEARFFKSTTFENIISDLSDIDFLRLNLGIYTDVYINEIENNFEKISSEIKSELQKSEYSKLDVEAIKILEAKAKKLITKNTTQFNGSKKKNKQKFEDFFYNIDKEKISKIKTEFKDLTGIEAAILIDKLVNKYKCLKITQGSHTKGLKPFFESHNLCDCEYAYLQRHLDVKQMFKGNNNERTIENIENKLNSIF